jgi:hypothetical protein
MQFFSQPEDYPDNLNQVIDELNTNQGQKKIKDNKKRIQNLT